MQKRKLPLRTIANRFLGLFSRDVCNASLSRHDYAYGSWLLAASSPIFRERLDIYLSHNLWFLVVTANSLLQFVIHSSQLASTPSRVFGKEQIKGSSETLINVEYDAKRNICQPYATERSFPTRWCISSSLATECCYDLLCKTTISRLIFSVESSFEKKLLYYSKLIKQRILIQNFGDVLRVAHLPR